MCCGKIDLADQRRVVAARVTDARRRGQETLTRREIIKLISAGAGGTVLGISAVETKADNLALILRNSQPIPPLLCVVMTPAGELTQAQHTSGNQIIQVLVQKERVSKEITRGRLLFSQGNNTFLRATATLSRSPASLGLAELLIEGDGINYSVSVDGRMVPHSTRAPIIIRNKGQTVLQGNFDTKTWCPVDLVGKAPNPTDVLRNEIQQQIEPLLAPLNSLVAYYVRKSKGFFPVDSNCGTPPTEAASFWGSLCRADCWASGGLLGAAGCVGTSGVACGFSVALGAAIASECSDTCDA